MAADKKEEGFGSIILKIIFALFLIASVFTAGAMTLEAATMKGVSAHTTFGKDGGKGK